MYIKRHLENVLLKQEYGNYVVAITGSRQTGKSTLLENNIGNIKQITFDDGRYLATAKKDPALFIQENEPPLFIDEVQYATEIMPYIKISVDKAKQDFMYFLTGSQKFGMMKGLTESLAGRVALYELLGLSMRELNNIDFYEPFLPIKEYYKSREKTVKEIKLWDFIHKGAYPEIHTMNRKWDRFYSDYVKTYIERDVSKLEQVSDMIKFQNFMEVAAARIGNLVNYDAMAREVGVSQPTAERWMSILVASNIAYLLPPYHNNNIKRVIKTPKLYFFDTGLAAYLSRWDTVEVLQQGAMNGAYFENFVINEIIKSYYNQGLDIRNFYFYRDTHKQEIDLLIKKGDVLYPIEIKKTASPDKNDVANFPALENIKKMKIGEGAVICNCDEIYPLKENIRAVPYWYI